MAASVADVEGLIAALPAVECARDEEGRVIASPRTLTPVLAPATSPRATIERRSLFQPLVLLIGFLLRS